MSSRQSANFIRLVEIVIFIGVAFWFFYGRGEKAHAISNQIDEKESIQFDAVINTLDELILAADLVKKTDVQKDAAIDSVMSDVSAILSDKQVSFDGVVQNVSLQGKDLVTITLKKVILPGFNKRKSKDIQVKPGIIRVRMSRSQAETIMPDSIVSVNAEMNSSIQTLFLASTPVLSVHVGAMPFKAIQFHFQGSVSLRFESLHQ